MGDLHCHDHCLRLRWQSMLDDRKTSKSNCWGRRAAVEHHTALWICQRINFASSEPAASYWCIAPLPCISPSHSRSLEPHCFHYHCYACQWLGPGPTSDELQHGSLGCWICRMIYVSRGSGLAHRGSSSACGHLSFCDVRFELCYASWALCWPTTRAAQCAVHCVISALSGATRPLDSVDKLPAHFYLLLLTRLLHMPSPFPSFSFPFRPTCMVRAK